MATGHITRGGNLGNGLFFDGVDDYIQLPYTSLIDFAVTDTYSVSSWIRPQFNPGQGVGYAPILNNYNGSGKGLFYIIRSTNGISFTFDVQIIQSVSSYFWLHTDQDFSFDKYYNLVFTKTGDTNFANYKMYVNGVLQSFSTSNSTTPVTTTSTDPYIIGKTTGVSSKYKGYIFGLSIFNRVLTAAEVKEMYVYEATSPSTAQGNIITNWSFDEKQGTVLKDYTNSVNGVLNNISTTSLSGSNGWVDSYTLQPIQR